MNRHIKLKRYYVHKNFIKNLYNVFKYECFFFNFGSCFFNSKQLLILLTLTNHSLNNYGYNISYHKIRIYPRSHIISTAFGSIKLGSRHRWTVELRISSRRRWTRLVEKRCHQNYFIVEMKANYLKIICLILNLWYFCFILCKPILYFGQKSHFLGFRFVLFVKVLRCKILKYRFRVFTKILLIISGF